MQVINENSLKIIKREGKLGHNILFVHGTSFGGWCWEEYFAPYFHKKGYNTYSFTFERKIENGKDKSNLKDYSLDFLYVLKKCAKPLTVIGHSVGCGIIMRNLNACIDDIDSLVLLTPIPYYSMRKEYIFFIKNFIKYKSFGKMYFGDRIEKESMRYYCDLFSPPSYRISMGLLNGIKKTRDFSKIRTLVVASLKDLGVSNRACIDVGRKFNAETIFFPNMCHAIMLDPEWKIVAETIHNFIQKEKS